MELREAIDSIWESTKQGIYFPSEWKGKLTFEEGYQVQLGLLTRNTQEGEIQAGWKVGLTSKAIQNQLDFHERVMGFLLESMNKPSGNLFVFDELVSPCFETELCVTLGADLKGPGVSQSQARAAFSHVAPAFELIERRGNFTADMALSMADNVQAKYFVTGEALALAKNEDLRKSFVKVVINGEVVDEASGKEVMGGPSASVAWLANRLADFGRKLEAGTRVMTGSLTRQYPIGQGDYVEADFEEYGRVVMEFE